MDKAYGGTVSSPRELETLEKEIESLSRTKDRIETELLDLFDQVDGEKQRADEQGRTVERLQRQLEETVITFERERERLTAEIEKLREEREAARAPLDAEVLRNYDYLRTRCGNVAVVAVENRTCSGCRIGLPIVQLNRLARNAELQQCENCLRLLWVPVEEDEE
jgi:predicted  nucleic acid-binding Zn-ribbon protein